MSRLRPLLQNLGVSASSLLIAALLFETAARLLSPGAEGDRGALGTPISRYHATLGWDKPPGGWQLLRRSEFEVEVRINARGLRGPDREYEKPRGTRRVLLLGDSFAEGYYADEDKTARAVLESGLATAGCGPVEVLNGGTAGYSTDQEYLFYKEEGRRYQPDAVIVFFYYNDLFYNTSPVGTAFQPKPYFDLVGDRLELRNVPVPAAPPRPPAEPGGTLRPWRGSVALRLLSNRTAEGNPRLHRALARLGVVEPISSEPPAEMTPYGPGGPAVRDMWTRTGAILTALKVQVEADGGRLGVLYVPSRFELTNEAWRLTSERYQWNRRWDPKRVADRLRALCDQLGLPLIDPRPPLTAAEGTESPAYLPRDGHWNAAGNQIVGREMLSPTARLAGCPASP